MKWFDFKDFTFLTLFIIVVISIVFIAAMIILFVISSKRDKEYTEALNAELNTTQIYSYYPKKNMVICFSRNNLRNKKIVDFDTFYSRFNEKEANKIKQWIEDIQKEKPYSSFLESNICQRVGSTKQLFALIKLLSYKEDLDVIHFELQILKSITPTSSNSKNNSSSFIGKQTMGTVSKLINKSRSNKGYTFAIRFSFFNQLAFKDNKEEKMMILKIKNAIYPFANDKSHPRQLVEVNEQEIIILDTKIDNKEEAYQLAFSLQMYIKRAILLNDYEQSIKFSIGIVKNYHFFRNFNAMVKHALEASLMADHENKDIYFYKKTMVPELNEEKYREQINTLIKEDKIRYLFRPIVDVKKKGVYGYLQSIKTYGSAYSNYNEIIRYASLCGKSHDLFAIVAKNVIPRFASEIVKENTPLFYPASIFDFDDIMSVFPQISRIEKIHLVLLFEETEISQNSQHVEEIIEKLNVLKHSGYDLALSVMDKSLLLDNTFYNIFDYFIAGTSMTGELKKNNFSRLSLRSLIESLLKYKKPIIATGLEGWASVELMIKSGVTLVSSEAISPSSEMILPVDKKKIKKLADLL